MHSTVLNTSDITYELFSLNMENYRCDSVSMGCCWLEVCVSVYVCSKECEFVDEALSIYDD